MSDRDVPAQATLIHDQFRAMLLSSAFPCLGGTSAVRRGHYRFGLFGAMSEPRTATDLARTLGSYLHDHPAEQDPILAFVAAFDQQSMDEPLFEAQLWSLLRRLAPRSEQMTGEVLAAGDPGFHFAGREFFIVGLHPAASRWARRFSWPVLVFNALSHAELLAAKGKTERMRERILARDLHLQGSPNPSLAASQRAQFSGRKVDDDWTEPTDD